MKTSLLLLLLLITISASAQRRRAITNAQERFHTLHLSTEQKRRIALLVLRERMQYYRNQQELNEILNPKQRKLLREWKQRDSVEVKR